MGAAEEGFYADGALLCAVNGWRTEEVLMVLGFWMVLNDCMKDEIPSKARGCGDPKKSNFLLDI